MEGNRYITRGVILECDKGSHCRRMNLIKDHGVSIEDEKGLHPLVLAKDIKIDSNIAWFGVCECYGGNDAESVTLAPDSIYKPEKDTENHTGNKCKPFITSNWNNVRDKVWIFGPDNENGRILTTASYLTCNYGGKIRIYAVDGDACNDGRDYTDEEK